MLPADLGTWLQSADTCRSQSTKYADAWPVPAACTSNLDLDNRQKQSLVSTSTSDQASEEGEAGDTPQVVELAVSWLRNQRWLFLHIVLPGFHLHERSGFFAYS